MTTTARNEVLALRQLRPLSDPIGLARALGIDRGIQVISTGRVLVRCPNPSHHDSTASCSILYRQEDATVSVNCFGCGFSGDALHLIAMVRGLDMQRDATAVFDEARRLAGLALRTHAAPARPRLVTPSPPAGPTRAERLFTDAATALLQRCPLPDLSPLLDLDPRYAQADARALGTGGDVAFSLLRRGLLAEAHADGWGVLPLVRRSKTPELDAGDGFDTEDDEGLEALLQELSGAGHVRRLGWLLQGRLVRQPGHRLLIPWRGAEGRLWTLQRRWCSDDGDTQAAPAKGGPGKYLFPSTDHLEPSSHAPYGWDRAEDGAAEELWLCEGAVDVLALRALNRLGLLRQGGGERSMAALGLAGLQSWTKAKEPVLQLARGRRVFLAFDDDDPAERAAEQIQPEVYRAGALQVRRVRPRQGKDWAEWLAAETTQEAPRA